MSELTLPGSLTSYPVQVAFVLERIDTALDEYERWRAAGGH